MVRLSAQSPLAGEPPFEIGNLRLHEVQGIGAMTSVAPYPGRQRALHDLLQNAHGLGFPAPGAQFRSETARCLWFGRDMALLIGVAPNPALAQEAALVDQSDGWAVLALDGARAVDVLARLTPLDLRPKQFPVETTARTELAHMMASVTRVSDTGFEIMVFRAFARTAHHKIVVAMERVAARARA